MLSEDTLKKVAGLPEFSRKVYEAINARLYAEPQFSDVEVTTIADFLQVKQEAVKAAVGRLIEAHLVYVEHTELCAGWNKRTHQKIKWEKVAFLHTYAHDRGELET
jgi:hypothetical protein